MVNRIYPNWLSRVLVVAVVGVGLPSGLFAQEEIRKTAKAHDQEEKVLVDDVEEAGKLKQETESSDSSADEKALFEKFEAYISKTKWTGNFTMTGQDLSKLNAESYEILSAEKLEEGDYWALKVRIKYGKKDQVVPIVVKILWAGRTPVITVDQLTIPGFGTFDARVVIRRGKYAGTWAHGEVGGHLFGEIKKMEEKSGSENKK